MNLLLIILPLMLLVVLLVIYYIFLIRVVLEMLSKETNQVLLVYTFLALIPLPIFIILGITILIIWNAYKRNLAENTN